jgi:hypothetical protein
LECQLLLELLLVLRGGFLQMLALFIWFFVLEKICRWAIFLFKTHAIKYDKIFILPKPKSSPIQIM